MKKCHFTKCISLLFLSISIVLLIYAYYRSEIFYHGLKGNQYFKYYLISLSGIFFWGFVLRLKEKLRANIVLLTISLIVGLYFIEVLLNSVIISQLTPDRIKIASDLGIRFDQRSKLEVLEDLNDNGIEAVPTITPFSLLKRRSRELDNDKLFTFGGVSNIETVGSNEGGQYSRYKSDRYGFNNPDSEWDAKQTQWLLTGDSFTQGVAVQPGEDIASRIREFTKESVINLGNSGNGPLIELAALREYAVHLQPKKVLWLYFERNDLVGELQGEKKNPLLLKYIKDDFSQNLINRQNEVDLKLRELILKEKSSKLKEKSNKSQRIRSILDITRILRLTGVRNALNFDSKKVVLEPLFLTILSKAKTRVEAWGGALYFVYLPEYSRYSKDVIHNNYRKKSKVLDAVTELNIPVIDIHNKVFYKHSDYTSLFPLGLVGHYNAEGYKEVAKAIIDEVQKYEE